VLSLAFLRQRPDLIGHKADVTGRSNSGSLAMFAACAAPRRAVSLGSQTWFSFFNERYGSPAAFPTTAPFFFESETAGLMFVRHRWPQGFRW
jgi:hypothetical protein